MYIKCDFSFMELRDNVWSGAVDTLKSIADAGLEDDFMNYMDEMWCDQEPTMTEINDWLWFDSEIIFCDLGLDEDGNLPNDDEDEDEGEDEEDEDEDEEA